MTTPPTTIGRYQIQGLLGKGGMSVVYLARDPRFNRDVAVKVLSRESLQDPGFRARFEIEAQTIASLEHAAIVPVHDFGEADGQLYLVMRHISGGSLADQLQKGPLHLVDVVRIFNRIAPALDMAHARGIIHRDLKPGNILFDGENEPYVADFGIAKLTSKNTEMTSTGLVIGTPAYMSPEQIRADRGVVLDGRSDIYALGAIVYNMLTAQVPYESESPSGMMMKHLMDPPPTLRLARSDLPEALQRVLDKAMAKKREDRYTTVTEMAAALEKASRGDTPHAGVSASAPTLVYRGNTPTPVAVPDIKTQVQIKAPSPVIPPAVRVPKAEKSKLPVWLIPGLVAMLALMVVGGWLALRGRAPAAAPQPTAAPIPTSAPPATTAPPAPTATTVPPTAAPTRTTAPTLEPTQAPTLTPVPAKAAAIATPAPSRPASAASERPAKFDGERFTGTTPKSLELPSTGAMIMRVKANASNAYFGVEGFDGNGEYTASYINTDLQYSGVLLINDEAVSQTLRLKVDAVGAWEIEFATPANARRITSAGKVSGTGDDVIVIEGGTWDAATVTGNKDSTFFDVSLFAAGKLESLLNSSEPVDGPLVLPRGTVTLVIKTTGPWSVTLFNK